MKSRILAVSIFLLTLTCADWLAYGDGCFVWRNRDIDILQPEQKALIEWDGKTEKLTIGTKYEGPADEMVWIVPVPTKPGVQKAELTVFDSVSMRTQTPYVLHASVGWPATSPPTPSQALVSREKVGLYDVAILAPVADSGAIRWLQDNGFPLPDSYVDVINRYVSKNWYIVASRVHPEELSGNVQKQLNEGTLHPLQMAFETTRCVYPMQMTALMAGPVEVLLWVKGPHHYEPETLAGSQWDVGFYGGPAKWEKGDCYSTFHANLSTIPECITKLRRKFQPREILDDIYFKEADYASYYDARSTSRVAMVATQLGSWQDPKGIPLLTEYLTASGSADTPDVRSAIWALGEICAATPNAAAEQLLADVFRRSKYTVACECLVALQTCHSRLLMPLLQERARQLARKKYGKEYSAERSYDNYECIFLCYMLSKQENILRNATYTNLLRKTIKEIGAEYGAYSDFVIAQVLKSDDPALRALARKFQKKAKTADALYKKQLQKPRH